MQPYFSSLNQNKSFNSTDTGQYGFDFNQSGNNQRTEFVVPHSLNVPLQRGVHNQMPTNIRSQTAMPFYGGNRHNQLSRGNIPVVENDPQKIEKLMKERNYKLQQQRLKDFNPSQGAKMRADMLIENVIGKLGSEQISTVTRDPTEAIKRKLELKSVNSVPNSNSSVSAATTLMGKFGNKARDWSTVGDLEQIFGSSTPEGTLELPMWCREGSTLVPNIYLEIERYVMRNGKIDTSLLYPILLSSGLSRETLGRLWELVNKETPGILNRTELYAVLAMIGLVQNSCDVHSVSILNSVPHPPIPLLNVVNNYAVSLSSDNRPQSSVIQQQSQSTSFDDFDEFQSAAPKMDPQPVSTSSVKAFSSSVGSRLANYDLTLPSEGRGENDLKEVGMKNAQKDLMDATEDKYDIFRFIDTPQAEPQIVDDNDDFGNFISSSEIKSDANPLEVSFTAFTLNDNFDANREQIPQSSTTNDEVSTDPIFAGLKLSPEDDDFGDFAAAEIVNTVKDANAVVLNTFNSSPLHSEVQSVASLDLGVVDTRSETPPVLNHTDCVIKSDSYQADALSVVDRYSFLKREVEQLSTQNNCHTYEWRRCLESCFQLIKNALDVFNSGSSSGVCQEVISCEEGENYVKSIIEIYRVACRIARWIGVLQGEDARSLKSTVKNIEDEWHRLLPFIVASPVVPSEKNSEFSILSRADQVVALKPCGVCLVDVERCDDDCAPHINLAQLTYGGRMYHATCANFWVNCVDSKLPSLPVLS